MDTSVDNKKTTAPVTYNDLLQQIDQFPTLDQWWQTKVFKPTMKQFLPQLFALIALEGGILYVHNWLAAFLGFVLIATASYRTLISMSISMLFADCVLRIRTAYQLGLTVGESQQTQNQPDK